MPERLFCIQCLVRTGAALIGLVCAQAPGARVEAAETNRPAPPVRDLWRGGHRSSSRQRMKPELRARGAGSSVVLEVCTDTAWSGIDKNATGLVVEAIAPGGRAFSLKHAGRGANVSFETRGWPNGPYEVRLSVGPPGRTSYRHLAWYKGDWRPQARELLESARRRRKGSTRTEDLRLGLLAKLLRSRLGRDPDAVDQDNGFLQELGEDRWRVIHAVLMEHRELLLGRRARPGAGGFMRLAWIDDVDGSPQFARVYLPRDYNDRASKHRWPMVVNLHGSNFRFPRYIHWGGVTRRHNWIAEKHNVIVLEPHGRGMTSFEGIGEQDVMRAIHLAKQKLHVDDERVYLMGVSMGGHGTYNVGTRHPGVFAALGSICGGGGFFRIYMDETEIARLSPRQRFLAEQKSAWVQADSLMTTPIFICHGDKDKAVSVEYSRYIVRMLEDWGYPVRYWELPGKGHGSMGCVGPMVCWLLQHRLDRYPGHVRLRAGALKSAEAHWVRVEQRRDPFAFMHVDASIIGANTVRMDTENVLQVRLAPGGALIDRNRPVRVLWNGDDAGRHKFRRGAITLRAPGYEPGTLRKRPALEGPISDLMTTPFALVVGTISPDERTRRFCRRNAEMARRAWRSWQHVEPRVFLDTEITEKEMAAYSLRLFGGPRENRATARLMGGLPLKIEQDAVTIDGNSFAAMDAAVAMLYPNPLNPDRYVCVTAGNSAAGTFFADAFDRNYDFIVTDVGGVVVSGRFDHRWRFSSAFADEADPAGRDPAARRSAPTRLDADADVDMLNLGELLETTASGKLVRNRGRYGQPLVLDGQRYESGLSVGAWETPHTMTFDLTGAGWKRMRSTIGIEPAKPAEELTERERAATAAFFEVYGDGKKLYGSPRIGAGDSPVEIDVDISSVKQLELRTRAAGKWQNKTASINWAEARITK